MKEKKKFSPLWLIPALVIIALILWCIHFPLTMFMGLDQDDFITQANIIEDKVGEDLLIKQSLSRTEDAELLSNIKIELNRVRCRFFGWYSYIEYTDGPLLWLDVTVDEENGLNGIQVITDNQGNIYLDYFKKDRGNIRLRAKDAALYDYLTELVESSEETVALNDGWNYTPDSNVVETVKSAILGEAEKDYCNLVVLHEAELDWDAWEWAIKQYTNFREGWTEEYLEENMMAVAASYTVEYDGTKTFRPSGKFERAFYLFFNSETQKWEIWESSAMPAEDAEEQAPPVVPEVTVDPSLYEQAQTQTFSFSDTLTVQVSNVIKTETRILPAEDNFEYEVYTVLPGAEIEVLHAAMVETSDEGLVGDWVLYDTIGNFTYIEPSMPNIPITETTRGIGSESVCVLTFELYTGEG